MINDINDIKGYEDLCSLTEEAWEQLMDLIAQEVDEALDQTSANKKKSMSKKTG
jgi:hypothetical protein